jgi:peroxiredoxin
MTLKKICFSLIFILLFCQFLLSQTLNPSITIRIKDGKYSISGILADKQIREDIIKIIKNQLGNDIDFSNLRVEEDVYYFNSNWQSELIKLLTKSKNSTNGLIQFTSDQISYPDVPSNFMDTEIPLTDNQTKIKLSDYKNKIIILTFIEEWSNPARLTAEALNDFYIKRSSNLQIIGVSTESSKDEKLRFRKYVKTHQIKFQTGWINLDFFNEFSKISKLHGVPQTFVIKDGKFRRIFLGGGKTINEKMVEFVEKLLKE